MDLGLTDKVVLITGASRGLGYATAYQFLLEGAQTIINSRSEENLLRAQQSLFEKTHRRPMIFSGDMIERSFAEKITNFIDNQYGKLDVLITNSGGPPPGNFESLSELQWDQAIELSFLSHLRLIKACLPLLRKSESPSVVTLTSYSTKQPIPNLILSNSIRMATIGMTKTLALEYGSENIRFNSILPGWTETERVENLMIDRAQKNGTSPEIEKQKQEKEIALLRMAKPEEFAKVTVFLASPAASYMTGLMISVDGGALKGTY
jgi:3-oxoacyl-[acyl-carrier protein] reductase